MAKSNNRKKNYPKEITFHYIKTPSYRSYHVDGVFGSLTPRGNLYCEFFIDRNVTPQTAVHELSKDGHLSGTPKKTTGKEGFVREIECGIIMDIDTVYNFREWLDDKIEKYKKDIKLFEKERKK
jgi:hypothetical protein